MRVMVIVKATPESESGALPSREMLTEMGKFNEELVKAGVMLSAEGLHSSAKGVRVRFGSGKSTVTDGPFTETKEVLGGYYLIDARDLDHALEIARLCPAKYGGVEVRPIWDTSGT
jgi:hypothetical protein